MPRTRSARIKLCEVEVATRETGFEIVILEHPGDKPDRISIFA